VRRSLRGFTDADGEICESRYFSTTRQSIVSPPGRGNTHEIEMAAENRGIAGRGVECNFCRDTKIFDAISAVRSALFEVTEPILQD
jgi:hypothetical protein